MAGGYIKLYRSMIDWEWYTEPNTMRVFLHLLLKANHKDNKWQGRTIVSGQTVTSRMHLAKELHLTEQQIRTALNRLKSTGEITIETTNRFSLVTLCNWASYQSIEDESTNKTTIHPTNKQPTDNQQITTNKNDKNDKNDKNEENTNIVSGDEISEPSVITIILNDKTEHPIYGSQIKQWGELYPAVDIMQALRNMKAWCIANPKNRKTKGGVLKFVNGWLSREQDKGRQVQRKPQKSSTANFRQRQYTEEQLEALIN